MYDTIFINLCQFQVARVTIHGQCQLVKNPENRINGLDIGIKHRSGVNLGTDGVNNAIY